MQSSSELEDCSEQEGTALEPNRCGREMHRGAHRFLHTQIHDHRLTRPSLY